MGKSVSFETEAKEPKVHGVRISAHLFVNVELETKTEWQDRDLFIDGLDEVHPGHRSHRDLLTEVSNRWCRLGKPKLRLSCRYSSWTPRNQKQLEELVAPKPVVVMGLEPLSESDKSEFLAHLLPEGDVDEFLVSAQANGVSSLLDNPLSLQNLVEAAKRGEWPNNLIESLSNACEVLVTEHNDDLRDLNVERDNESILDTAGRICIALLLSGGSSISLDDLPTKSQNSKTFSGNWRSEWQKVLDTKLFKYSNDELGFIPIHRVYAEFLAARYISKRVNETKLSLNRLLPLMFAWDGRAVTELHGVIAWIAMHNPQGVRYRLIQSEPIAVAQYGDFAHLRTEDRKLLLNELLAKPYELKPETWDARSLKSLVHSDTVALFKNRLTEDTDLDGAVIGKAFLAMALSLSKPIAGLYETLLRLLRDEKQNPGFREYLLDAALHYQREFGSDTDIVEVLDQIIRGSIPDPDSELLGCLLGNLYPTVVKPQDIWHYYRPGPEFHFGSYWKFWHTDLQEDSNCFAELLDSASANLAHLKEVCDRNTCKLLVKLLQIELSRRRNGVKRERIYNWLCIGYELKFTSKLNFRDLMPLIEEIEKQPKLQIDVFSEGIQRNIDKPEIAISKSIGPLLQSNLSEGFYTHCVKESLDLYSKHAEISTKVLQLVIERGRLPSKRVLEMTDANLILHTYVKKLIDNREAYQNSLENTRRFEDTNEYWVRKDQEKHQKIKEQQFEFSNNRGALIQLYESADVYLQDYGDLRAEVGRERLLDYLKHDAELQKAVLYAFRNVFDRSGFPGIESFLVHLKSRRELLVVQVCLAGLEELHSSGELQRGWWNLERIHIALTILYSKAYTNYVPNWYMDLLETNLDEVAVFLLKHFNSLKKSNFNIAQGCIHFSTIELGYKMLAEATNLQVLRDYPLKVKSDHLFSLECLLHSSRMYSDIHVLNDLIAEKLVLISMPVRQRVIWLAYGCTIDFNRYETKLNEFLNTGNRRNRVMQFVNCFEIHKFAFRYLKPGSVQLLSTLISEAGQYVSPVIRHAGRITDYIGASSTIFDCIQLLSSNTTEGATDALRELASRSELQDWQTFIEGERQKQRSRRMECEFRAPDKSEVFKVLDGGEPVSPADLWGITIDCIAKFQSDLKNSRFDPWTPFWKSTRNRKDPKNWKLESDCTKYFVDKINDSLPNGCSIEIEYQVRKGRRPDAVVKFGNFCVPIEAKRTNHREIWNAVQSQLFEKYVESQSEYTHGYGLYVIYWFGEDGFYRSEDNRSIKTPEQLQLRIEETLTSDEQRRKLQVIVLDVSGS